MDIQGQENQLILAFPDREVRCLDTADNRINRMLERSNISIIGNNNRVLLHFESEDSAEELLTGAGFLLIVKGDGNEVDYLQEDHSRVSIGDDSQLSWGVDVWCTDAHTITDLEGNPVNYAESIEIGRHVWVGKDVKIGKNVRIADNSIVGWGSIVTKRFDEPNVILAGTPAKIVKRGINWDRKCINKYAKGL